MLRMMQQHPLLTYPLCLFDPQTQLSRPLLVLTEHSSHAALQVERDKTFSRAISNMMFGTCMTDVIRALNSALEPGTGVKVCLLIYLSALLI